MTTTVVSPTQLSRSRVVAKPGTRHALDFAQPTSTVAGGRRAATEFSLELTEVQLQTQAWVHDFAAGVIRPAAHEWDEREEPPWPIIEEAARVGLYSLDFVANAFGDPTGVLLPVVMEEVAWGDAAIALAIHGTGLAVAGIIANGTPEQVAEWLPACFEGDSGKVNLAAFGVSEPDAGSAGDSPCNRAVYDGAHDEWILNGTTTFVTNGGIADVHVLVVSVDPELGARGQARFVVPPGTPGLAIGQRFVNRDIHGPHTAKLILEDCRVPGRCLLGGYEGLNERLARAREGSSVPARPGATVFEASRFMVGAQAVGIGRAAYDYALEHAKKRKRYGRPIVEDRTIAFMLADMKMRTDAARLLVWRAAWMAAVGKPLGAAEDSMSKLYAGEHAVWVTDQAIEIAGSDDYMRDYPLERWHRDAEFITTFDGGSEVERLNIARAISDVRFTDQMTERAAWSDVFRCRRR